MFLVLPLWCSGHMASHFQILLVCVEDQISWLKHILHDDGKLTKILQAMCPLNQNVKQRVGDFANITMQRVKKNFLGVCIETR